jgi:hypothetical protein
VPLEIRVSHRERYLSAKVAGRASVRDIHDMLDTLSDESMRLGARRILVDLTQVQEQFTSTDHLSIGDQAALNLGHLEKIASVVAEGRRKGTSEQVAGRRGVTLRVFTSEREAMAWLEE